MSDILRRPYISPEMITQRAEQATAARERRAEAERLERELVRLDAEIVIEQQLANHRLEEKLRRIGIDVHLGVLRPPPIARARKPKPRTLTRPGSGTVIRIR